MQKHQKIEKDVERSLDRLIALSKQPEIAMSIPAYFYSADLLLKYANSHTQLNSQYFTIFKDLIEQLPQKDFSKITKNQQDIVDQILEIVNSHVFLDCMRPDIKSIRDSKIHIEYVEEEETTSKNNILLAKENYKFQISEPALEEGVKSFNKRYENLNGLKSSGLKYESPVKTGSQMQSSSPLKNGMLSKDMILNQYEELWRSIEKSYFEHDLDQAYLKSLQYVEKLKKRVQIPQAKLALLDTINLEYETMTSFYNQFDLGDWIFDREANGITLEYKIYEEEKQIAIRIQGEFDIGIEPFLAIISEIDLMGEYVPFCYDSKTMKIISRNQKIGTSKIYIPLITDRETYFYAAGYDRIREKGSVFLFSKTINTDELYQAKYDFKVPEKSEYIRLEYKFFIVEYIPTTKHRAKIRLASKVDMKLNFLPQFILHKSARIFAFDYFKNIWINPFYLSIKSTNLQLQNRSYQIAFFITFDQFIELFYDIIIFELRHFSDQRLRVMTLLT